MPHAHLHAQWRNELTPLEFNQRSARVSNGVVRVLGIGERSGTTYLLLDEGYECPAEEVERVQPNGHGRHADPSLRP